MILITITLILKKNGIQSLRNNKYDLIRELRSHIQIFQNEVHFLREELKEKLVFLQSLIIANNNQKNNTSNKTPENLIPTFPSKENNSDTKELVPPIKDGVIDFCIDDAAIKIDTNENKRNDKSFNNRGYSLFFLMDIFAKHL